MRKTQTRSDTLYEVPGVVQKEGEKALCVCVRAHVRVCTRGGGGNTSDSAGGRQCAVCLGNRTQSDYLQQQKPCASVEEEEMRQVREIIGAMVEGSTKPA